EKVTTNQSQGELRQTTYTSTISTYNYRGLYKRMSSTKKSQSTKYKHVSSNSFRTKDE
ncbi:unnamed protein product, partial [Arabidopsis halleri]